MRGSRIQFHGSIGVLARRGGWTPGSHYDEGFDYDAFRTLLLQPLGPGGSRRCRPALFDAFHDVWLEIEMETMVERACRRDVAWVGSAAVVEDRYRGHWIPTHELYERLTEPPMHAHAIIDNRIPQEPKLLRLSRP